MLWPFLGQSEPRTVVLPLLQGDDTLGRSPYPRNSAAAECCGVTADDGLQLGYNSNTRYLLALGMQPSVASLLFFIFSGP